MPFPTLNELMNPENMLKSFLQDTFEVFATKWQLNKPLPSAGYVAPARVRPPSVPAIRPPTQMQTGEGFPIVERVKDDVVKPPTPPTAPIYAPTRAEIWERKAAGRRRKMDK